MSFKRAKIGIEVKPGNAPWTARGSEAVSAVAILHQVALGTPVSPVERLHFPPPSHPVLRRVRCQSAPRSAFAEGVSEAVGQRLDQVVEQGSLSRYD